MNARDAPNREFLALSYVRIVSNLHFALHYSITVTVLSIVSDDEGGAS